jgi:cell cycle checkpoint protein
MDSNHAPIFTAVSSSARQLFLLLRCIGSSAKAEVQITTDGLRFSVEESRAVQGLTFLEKTLFSSYTCNTSSISDASPPDESTSIPSFQINLAALLETLQIFGLSDVTSASRNPNGGFTSSYTHNAFNTPTLAITGGTCRISYPYLGAPLSITISEAGVTTTCDLNTYESSAGAGFDVDESIPLQRDALTLKIIMRSTWLFDAITELASTNPTVLVLTASRHTLPLFALEGAGGPFGDSMVDFQPEPSHNRSTNSGTDTAAERDRNAQVPQVSETFTVFPVPGTAGRRVCQRYKFEHVQKAARAMGLASKVCIRCDRQGVLSMQFMVELSGDGVAVGQARDRAEGNGAGGHATAGVIGERASFVDFRFVPLFEEEEDEEESNEREVGMAGESDGSTDSGQ